MNPDLQELEKRIKKLEEDRINVNMNYGTDTNILRALQRALTNGTLGLGTSNTVKSALLELVSTTKGLVLSRMTSTQRDAIVNPTPGLVIYNTTTDKINFYDSSATWRVVTST